MVYNEYNPIAHLAPYVKCFWTLQIESVQAAQERERIMPDGTIELIFHYGDKYQQFDKSGGVLVQPRSFLYGQLTSYIEIAPTGNTGIMGIRFYPHGLAAFINMPVSECTAQVVTVYDVFGASAAELEDKIMTATSDEARVVIMNEYLINRLQPAMGYAMAYAVQSIQSSKGSCSITKLAADVCMSERQLERKFMATVGMSPKAFSRVIRFSHSLKMLQSGLEVGTLSDIAHAMGYYDQAHFIRDFKEYAGMTPMQYCADNHHMSDLFVGSE